MPVIGERIGRRTLLEEAKLLQKRVKNRERQLQRLVEQHQQLQLQYELLSSIASVLAELRDDVCGDAELRDLASEEALLQLGMPSQGVPACIKQEPESSMPAVSFWQQEQQSGVETISPQGKPLQLLTSLMARPPFPVTQTYPTLQDLRNVYTCMIRELSLALQHHAAGSAALQFAAEIPLQKIKAVMLPYLHLLYTLSRPTAQPNSDLIAFQLCMINVDTGQPLTEPDPQHYAWVVSQLGLTRQQQLNISTGFAVFKRLIASVLNEQRQEGAGPTAPAGPAAPAAGRSNRRSRAGSSAQQQEQEQDDDILAHPFAHRKRLALQQKRMERLQILQRKEMMLRGLSTAYLWGCLTWEQMARLHVLLFPIAPLPGMVAATIARLAQPQEDD